MNLVFANSKTRAGRRARAELFKQEEAQAKKEVAEKLTAKEVQERKARARRQVDLIEARKNVPAFIEYALRNEQDDTKLLNADFHKEWQTHFDDHKFAVLIAPVEHAKTQQIAVARVLHSIGVEPNEHIGLISNTAPMAQKILRQIRAEIERNPRVRDVFPNMRRSPHRSDPWTQQALTVDRQVTSKDPTIQACGVYGPIVGSRLSKIILDDVLDFENTRTDEQRRKLIEWFDTTVFTRLVKGGCIWAIGTPWDPGDFLHELEKRPAFFSKRYSAVKNPQDIPERWVPSWPEQWDRARLLERKANMADGVFARKYLCQVRTDQTSRFRAIWLERMVRLGKGRTFLASPPKTHAHGPPLACFTGVDLGVGDKDPSALTVIFTIGLMPDGRRVVVDIESGRWQAPEIIDRLRLCYQRYDSEILVESNGAQKFIVQMCEGQVPVTAFHTGKNKWSEEWGVESLAVEIRNGQWVMPSGGDGTKVHPEGQAFIDGCLHYDPEQHTSDHLMAAWLARESLRKFSRARVRRMDTLSR